MNRVSFALLLLGLAVGAPAAHAYTVREPLLAIACHLEPAFSPRRANGYDCTVSSAIKQGTVAYPSHASDDERLLRRNRAFYRLALEAERACGSSCRYFYGTLGAQCLAVAQSPQFTGLGSFMGRELTQADAEATALQDCVEFVGQPGTECRIVLSVCTDPLPR